MSREQKQRALVLAALCIAYTLAFVPANLTGAADVNMLGVFKADEFGQFRVLWRMTSPSLSESVFRFIAYDYYWYGFPFFAVSAAVFWPLRMIYVAAAEPA